VKPSKPRFVKTLALCRGDVKCPFKRWSRLRRTDWLLPLCKWDGTCNLKYEVAITHTNDDELVKKLRVDIKERMKKAKIQPIW